MLGLKKTGMILGLLLMSLYGCQTSPKPCDCGEAEAQLRHYAEGYFHQLAANGVLRQDLKACHERK